MVANVLEFKNHAARELLVHHRIPVHGVRSLVFSHLDCVNTCRTCGAERAPAAACCWTITGERRKRFGRRSGNTLNIPRRVQSSIHVAFGELPAIDAESSAD